MITFKQLCETLEAEITNSYEVGVSANKAEELAGRFLQAQFAVSSELAKKDLDSRMRKSGLKAVKAAIYMDAASKGDKKPTEASLSATVDMNELVQGEQHALDEAEVERDELERYYNVFRESHIFYRGISKGKFE
jgi:hypothetical protein